MGQIQHYASVDARKCLESGVAKGRYKPVFSVDRPLFFHDNTRLLSRQDHPQENTTTKQYDLLKNIFFHLFFFFFFFLLFFFFKFFKQGEGNH